MTNDKNHPLFPLCALWKVFVFVIRALIQGRRPEELLEEETRAYQQRFEHFIELRRTEISEGRAYTKASLDSLPGGRLAASQVPTTSRRVEAAQ